MTGTAIQRYLEVKNFDLIFENLQKIEKTQRFIRMKILISFLVGMSISGTVRDRRSVPQMAEGPPGMIVAPSGAVYKPEECGMDGNGDGWCAGESVPAEYFIEKEKLKKNKKVKRSFIIKSNLWVRRSH